MKTALCLMLLCLPACAGTCPNGQPKNAATLAEIEHTWAKALEVQNISDLRCILADEFEDADPSGATGDRSKVLERASTRRGVPHALSELHARVYGDFAYIRGLATTERDHVKQQVRFTDVYVYRDGRWQCVAAHESSLPPPVH